MPRPPLRRLLPTLALLAATACGTLTAPQAASSPPALGPEDAAPVTRVVDGDTIHVRIAGQDRTVRYIGMDTPETVDPRRPVQAFGKEAAERNRQLVAGKIVRLEKDMSETDRFGRLLRYVYVDGRMVNAVLVEEGYARAATFPPDVRHKDLFLRLEREARAANRGLWAGGP